MASRRKNKKKRKGAQSPAAEHVDAMQVLLMMAPFIGATIGFIRGFATSDPAAEGFREIDNVQDVPAEVVSSEIKK